MKIIYANNWEKRMNFIEANNMKVKKNIIVMRLTCMVNLVLLVSMDVKGYLSNNIGILFDSTLYTLIFGFFIFIIGLIGCFPVANIINYFIDFIRIKSGKLPLFGMIADASVLFSYLYCKGMIEITVEDDRLRILANDEANRVLKQFKIPLTRFTLEEKVTKEITINFEELTVIRPIQNMYGNKDNEKEVK